MRGPRLPVTSATRLRRHAAALTLAIYATFGAGVFLGSEGCRTIPSTIQTPQGQVAYQLEDAVDAINSLQHAAITARRAGKLSVETEHAVIRYRKAAAATIDKAIDNGTGKVGAIRTAVEGLSQLEAILTTSEQSTLKAALTSLRTVLQALGEE